MNKLLMIKWVHTLIWAFFAGLIFYILYAGISGHIGNFVYAAIGLVLLETVVLLVFSWSCPLTLVAEKYTDSRKANFDIFLPEWLAKHNKTLFGILYVVGILLVLWRVY